MATFSGTVSRVSQAADGVLVYFRPDDPPAVKNGFPDRYLISGEAVAIVDDAENYPLDAQRDFEL